MITKAEYENWIGVPQGSVTDEQFEKVLLIATTRLEQALGYQLCPLDGLGITFCPLVDTPPETPEQVALLPTLSLPYKAWQKNLVTPPFLKLYSVTLVTLDGEREELDADKYYVGRLSQFLNVDWNNTINLYHGCCYLPRLGCCNPVTHVEIKAYWGLCCGELVEESGEADELACCLPEDLKALLLSMMVEAGNSKSNVKSESILSHSYTLFEKEDLFVEYAGTLAKYAISRPEEYPL
jgi:hypothetical protein